MSIAGRIGGGRSGVTQPRGSESDVVLGEDWVAPKPAGTAAETGGARPRRRPIALHSSPLARKIITFNLLAMAVMVAGVLYLNPFRDSLVFQRESAIVNEAELIADVFEARMPKAAPVNLAAGDGIDLTDTLAGIELPEGTDVYVFDTMGNLLVSSENVPTAAREQVEGLGVDTRSTVITSFLNRIWDWVSHLARGRDGAAVVFDTRAMAESLVPKVTPQRTQMATSRNAEGATIFSVATGLYQNERMVGVVALTSAAGEIDALVRVEREQVLQMFVIAIIVSIGLSLVCWPRPLPTRSRNWPRPPRPDARRTPAR